MKKLLAIPVLLVIVGEVGILLFGQSIGSIPQNTPIASNGANGFQPWSFLNSWPAVSGFVSRQPVAKMSDWVSVKDTGAVGDGTTDDTAGIQNCLNAYMAQCYFPPSVGYVVSRSLNLTVGPAGGSGAHLVCAVGGNDSPIIWKGPSSEFLLDATGNSHVIIDGCSFKSSSSYPLQGFILFSRDGGTSADNNELNDVTMSGYCSIACLYEFQSESNSYHNLSIANFSTGGYGWVRSAGTHGTPEFAITSLYQTPQASGGNTRGLGEHVSILCNYCVPAYFNSVYNLTLVDFYTNTKSGGDQIQILNTDTNYQNGTISMTNLRQEGSSSIGIHIKGNLDGLMLTGGVLLGTDTAATGGIYADNSTTVSNFFGRNSSKLSPPTYAVNFYNLSNSDIDLNGLSGQTRNTSSGNTIRNANSYRYGISGNDTIYTMAGESHTGLLTDYTMRIPTQPFAYLPACGSTNDGEMARVYDSTASTWGASTSGGGSHAETVICNGSASAWQVH